MARTTKTPAKKAATAKKAAVTKKAPPKKAPAGRPTTKATVKKSPAKKAPAKKAPAKKAPVGKKVAAKKTAAAPKKAAVAKKAPAKKVPAPKSPAKKAEPAKKVAAKKAEPAKKAAPKKPAKSPYDKKFLEAQRESLIVERARLTKDVDSLMAEATELASLREPGDVQFDEESGEGDTLAVERERDLALSAQFRAHIEDIDHALAKIDANTYGLCEVSGQSIPKERLRAIPWARERVEYKVGGFRR
jgi:RNA polymerase-binding transcription factor DksA